MSQARRTATTTVAAVVTVALAAVAWVASVRQMSEMGMGIDPLGPFLALWVTMMAAMMLPSAVPMVSSFVAGGRIAGGWLGATAILIAAYVSVWTAFGALAYLVLSAVIATGLL